jgi:hypothetical protein
MGVLILLIIEIVMTILFTRRASPRVNSILSTFARSILSFLNNVCFTRPKLSFFFPPSHPFSLRSKNSQIKYPIIHVKSLHSFPSCSYPVISHEDAQELQVHHSSFSFLLRWSKFKLSVLIISLSLIQIFFPCWRFLPKPLLFIHLSLFLPGVP